MLRRGFIYGCAGVLVENLFTGARAFLAGDLAAPTRSYLWMLPIYGLGALLMRDWLQTSALYLSRPMRIFLGVWAVYLIEGLTGALLKAALGTVPWDYGVGSLTPGGLINFAYAPAWCVLLFVFDLHVQANRKPSWAREAA